MPFIVFEGGEGVGKSTQLNLLAKTLSDRGAEVVTTREPGGTPFAEGLRALFKDNSLCHDEPTPWTELLVVAAARAQHLERLIRPLRSGGEPSLMPAGGGLLGHSGDRAQGPQPWILCDRFLDSALVYQGVRGALGPEAVLTLHRLFMSAADVPDATLILDCDAAAAQARVHKRVAPPPGPAQAGGVPPGDPSRQDRLDGMSADLHVLLRQGFLGLARTQSPYPCGTRPRRHVIDAAGRPDEVAARIQGALGDLFP